MTPVIKMRQEPKFCYIRKMALYLETEMLGVGMMGSDIFQWSEGRKQCSETGTCRENCVWALGTGASTRDGMVRLPGESLT